MGQGFRQLNQSDQRQGAQVVFDAVAGPLFEPALRCLRIAAGSSKSRAGDRRVSFDLLDFYHNESRQFGVDTRKRDATASAVELEALTPFFEDGVFQAPVIDRAIPLSEDVLPTCKWPAEKPEAGSS